MLSVFVTFTSNNLLALFSAFRCLVTKSRYTLRWNLTHEKDFHAVRQLSMYLRRCKSQDVVLTVFPKRSYCLVMQHS